MEHPRLVSRFDEVAAVDENEDGYHISKAWLKGVFNTPNERIGGGSYSALDWRLAKPKMHVEGAPDPPPDAEDYLRDVVCEHGGLTTNVTSRRRISAEAYGILQDLFPNWRPPSTSAEPCPVCEALMHISKEDRREYRKQAEEEKVRLHVYHAGLELNARL